MEIVAWAGILTGVILYLGWPILRSAAARSRERRADVELQAGKEEAYAALSDLELDYRMGKISEADYRELRDKYRAEALALLGAIDEKHDVGALVERDVEARRKLRAGAATVAALFVLLWIPALALASDGAPGGAAPAHHLALVGTTFALVAALGALLAGVGQRQVLPLASAEMLEKKYQALVEALARLDDDFAACKLRPDKYRRLRAKRKTELLAVAERRAQLAAELSEGR